MKITVIYTLPLREHAGVKEEPFEMEGDSSTVKTVLNLIVQRHPSMGEYVESKSEEAQRRRLVVAVNSRLAKFSDTIRDGDRVSLLLPVIGGSGEQEAQLKDVLARFRAWIPRRTLPSRLECLGRRVETAGFPTAP